MQPKWCRHAIGAVMLIAQVHGKSLGGNTQRELLEAVRPLLAVIVSQDCPVEKELFPRKEEIVWSGKILAEACGTRFDRGEPGRSLAQNRASRRLSCRPFSVAVGMQALDPGIGGGRLGGLGQIFVAIEADCNPDFLFSLRIV